MRSAACCCISLYIIPFLVAAPAFLNPRFSTYCFFSEYNLSNGRITLTVPSLLSFPFIKSVRFAVFHALGIMALTNCRYCGYKEFQPGPVSYPYLQHSVPQGLFRSLSLQHREHSFMYLLRCCLVSVDTHSDSLALISSQSLEEEK